MNTPINQQTPGPLKVAGSCHVKKSITEWYHVAHVGTADDFLQAPGVAEVNPREYRETEREALHPDAEQAANARLLAASYTAFDSAGRALGVDAAELAEKIDLEKLIRAAQDAVDMLDGMMSPAPYAERMKAQLRAALPPVFQESV